MGACVHVHQVHCVVLDCGDKKVVGPQGGEAEEARPPAGPSKVEGEAGRTRCGGVGGAMIDAGPLRAALLLLCM
jgi:hypothetical protein